MRVAVDQTGRINLDLSVYLAKKGDPAAFEKLITDNKTSLYRVAKGILRADTDINDAIQETIFKAYLGLPRLKNDSYFKTWLIKILINECNSILRQHKKTIPLADVNQNTLIDNNTQDKMELMDVINCLEEDLKAVTLLYYYEDFSVKTIASIINVPEGTVKSRLSRARTKLYSLLTAKEVMESERPTNR